jgi:hypothetical protein
MVQPQKTTVYHRIELAQNLEHADFSDHAGWRQVMMIMLMLHQLRLTSGSEWGSPMGLSSRSSQLSTSWMKRTAVASYLCNTRTQLTRMPHAGSGAEARQSPSFWALRK